MKRLFILFLFGLFFVSCENGGGTNSVMVTPEFPEGKSCATYGVDTMNLNVYDQEQLVKALSVPCTKDTSALKIESMEKGSYIFEVEATDSRGNILYIGEKEATITGDDAVTVTLKKYKGGILFKWNSELCETNKLNTLMFTIEKDGTPLLYHYLDKTFELKDYKVECNANIFYLKNIEAGDYTVTVKGYRADSSTPRMEMEPEEKTVPEGIDLILNLSNLLTLGVSDLKISYEFESKLITNCEEANVETLSFQLLTTDDEKPLTEKTIQCKEIQGEVELYDIPEGSYILKLITSPERYSLKLAPSEEYDWVEENNGEIKLEIETGRINDKEYDLTVYIGK